MKTTSTVVAMNIIFQNQLSKICWCRYLWAGRSNIKPTWNLYCSSPSSNLQVNQTPFVPFRPVS